MSGSALRNFVLAIAVLVIANVITHRVLHGRWKAKEQTS